MSGDRPRAMPARPAAPPAERAVSDVIAGLVTRLQSADAADVLRDFWHERTSPVVEPLDEHRRRVTVLAQSETAAIVFASINRVTNDLVDATLERVPGTDVWHATFVLPASWRGSYTLTAFDDGELGELCALEPRWAMRHLRERGNIDPRNPDVVGAYGDLAASVCALDEAPAQPWLAPAAVRGFTRELRAPNGRRVWLHVPAGGGNAPRPLVIALDGEVWHGDALAANAVDHVPPHRAPVVAMVDSGGVTSRMRDLAIDGGMSDEIVSVLVPWLRTVERISDDPADIIVSGESLGGLTALKTAFDHPQVVGAALAQSSSLWQHDMIERARSASAVRLFIAVGTFEPTLIEPHRALRASGALDGHDVTYLEYDGGHDTACWRGFWADGVRTLLGIGR